jgi:hypothetical protein
MVVGYSDCIAAESLNFKNVFPKLRVETLGNKTNWN